MLDNSRLGMLANGVRSFGGSRGVRVLSSVRVLGRRGNDRRSSSRRSSVRVLNGFVNNRVNLACCRLGCGSGRRVMDLILLAVVGSGGLVGVVGVVGGFDGLDAVVGHAVCLDWRCGLGCSVTDDLRLEEILDLSDD
jgi:hypothetical protein